MIIVCSLVIILWSKLLRYNYVDLQKGNTALHYAATGGAKALVEVLTLQQINDLKQYNVLDITSISS